MNVLDAQLADGRKTRIFFNGGAQPQATQQQLEAVFWAPAAPGDDPHARYAALYPLLKNSHTLTAIVSPQLEVFLRGGMTKRVFACALVAPSDVAQLVANAPIVETLSMQVLPSDDINGETAAQAVRDWILRCFPAIVPGIMVMHWATPEEMATPDGMTLHEMTAPARPV